MTIFNAVQNSKFDFPVSPYEDKSFYFTSLNIEDLHEIQKMLVHNYLLTIDLKPGRYRLRRTMKDLSPFQSKYQNFFILDFKCNIAEKYRVCEYFSKYRHIIMDSPTGVRGYIAISDKIKIDNIFSKIYFDLKHLGELQANSISGIGFSKPLPTNVVISENSSGKIFDESYIPPKLNHYKLESTNLLDICKEYFNKDGFVFDGSKYIKDNLKFNWSPKYPWIMFCENPAYNKNIYPFISKYKSLSILKSLECEPNIEVNVQSLKECDYKETCDNFLKNGGVLGIKSYMGSNKSEMLEYIIKKSKKILVITSRISLAQEFKRKFNLPLYSDFNIKNFKYNGSLICQYDSLTKINPNNYDTVIIDEFVSVLFHSTDNLADNFKKKELVQKFLSLLQKNLVVSDAFLNKEVLKIIGRKITLFVNKARDKIPLIEYDSDGLFRDMAEKLSSGEQVSISTNSVKSIENKIAEICLSLDKTSVIVTGPKPENYKESALNSLNKKQYKQDIVIYSPTLSLGVSIFSKIKNHYHYDTGNSSNAIQSIQMLRRTRKVETIHYFIEERTFRGSTDFESLKKYLESNMNAKNSWIFDFCDDFSNKIMTIGKYYIQVEVFKNILKSNTKISFNEFLKYNFQTIHFLEP